MDDAVWTPTTFTKKRERTDPDSRLAKKTRGSEAKLAYLGEVLMDNRHALIADACVVHATGTGECAAALGLLAALPPREATVGADKAYDNRAWVHDARQLGITPHVAQKQHSAIDGRTTRHPGYAVSQRVRKRVEEIFGWMKTVGATESALSDPGRPPSRCPQTNVASARFSLTSTRVPSGRATCPVDG